MTYEIIITKEASIEFEILYKWYLDINVNLGIKFSNEFYEALDKLINAPYNYSYISKKHRRILFGKINAMIVFEIENRYINILSIKDSRSKPNKDFY